jgi:hypothetical protein
MSYPLSLLVSEMQRAQERLFETSQLMTERDVETRALISPLSNAEAINVVPLRSPATSVLLAGVVRQQQEAVRPEGVLRRITSVVMRLIRIVT